MGKKNTLPLLDKVFYRLVHSRSELQDLLISEQINTDPYE